MNLSNLYFSPFFAMLRPLISFVLLICIWLHGAAVHARSIDAGQLQALVEQAQTDPKVAKQLAYRYIKGNGVSKDVAKGLLYLEKAAVLGDQEALSFLGKAYTNKKSPLYDPQKYLALKRQLEGPSSVKVTWRKSEELLDALRKSKARVSGTGSAFAMSKTGAVITTHHVIDGCDLPVVIYNHQFGMGEVLSQDKNRDLALVKVNEQTPNYLQIRTSSVSLGESVSIGGFPFSAGEGVPSFAFNVGVVGTFPVFKGVQHIQVSAPIASGNSGGPAIDETGAVLGVVVGKIPAGLRKDGDVVGDNYNFVISNKELVDFLEKRNVAFAGATANRKLNPKQSAEMLEGASAQILCIKK